MTYASLLKKSIKEADLSLRQICNRLKHRGVIYDVATLSKIQNGKKPPASDRVNIALADVLGIDADQLRIAAIKEVIPPELLVLIKKVG